MSTSNHRSKVDYLDVHVRSSIGYTLPKKYDCIYGIFNDIEQVFNQSVA